MVPEGWSIEPLGSLAEVNRGKFSARPRNDPRFYGGEHPFVQTGDVTRSSTYLAGHSQTLNDEGLAVSKMFPADTILMTIAANIGDVALTTYPVACPDSVVGINAKQGKADAGWLIHRLQLEKGHLDRAAPKMAQKNINLEVLRPLPLLAPPLPEQRKIAEILSTWDRAIETTEALLANARTQKRALMQSLLTGKRRFPEFEGQEWREVRFHDVFDRVRRKNTVGNENTLTISGQDGLVSQQEYFNKRVAAADLSGYTLLVGGDFAYNKSYSAGYPMGAIKMQPDGQTGVVSSLYLCFALADPEDHCREFFRHFFEAGCFNREIYKIAQEGARNHGLLNVSVHDFFGARLRIPSVEEQRRIAEVINLSEQQEDHDRGVVERLRIEKKALMQQLLTGKRRVTLPSQDNCFD